MDNLTFLNQTLDQLNAHIPKASLQKAAISKWSVGMQIEHALISTHGICQALIDSKPYPGKVKKGFIRGVIMLTGFIPRGRGKAPQASLPNEKITEPELYERLSKAREVAQKAAMSAPDSWWKHAIFGIMKRDEALKFTGIHNKHHLKIIQDILSDN